MRPVSRRWAAVVLVAVMAGAPPVTASSHREAPFVARNPKVDGTDLYLFRSYETGREGYVTLIANYQPYQDAFGGPEFFPLDPGALYEIHVDNNGDAREDLTFRFRFVNELAGGQGLALTVFDRPVHVPLLNIGPVSLGDDSALNVIESYSVELIRGDRNGPVAGNLTNVEGAASGVPQAHRLRRRQDLRHVRLRRVRPRAHLRRQRSRLRVRDALFVGQRHESFAINAGALFDLVNMPPGVLLGPPDQGTGRAGPEEHHLARAGASGRLRHGDGPGHRRLDHGPRSERAAPPAAGRLSAADGWLQASRVAGPLVNSLFIGAKDKDRFNGSRPADDAQFADYVTHPTLARDHRDPVRVVRHCPRRTPFRATTWSPCS